MRFLISTKGLENDPKFKNLLGDYSLAKTALMAYFLGVMQEDLSNAPLKDQLLQADDGE